MPLDARAPTTIVDMTFPGRFRRATGQRRTILIIAASVAVLAIGVALVLALMPRDEESLAVAVASPEPSAETTPSPSPSPSPTPEGLAPGEVIATTAVAMLDVHGEPGGEVTHELDEWSAYFQPLTLMAVDRATLDGEEWLQVDLPLQPNGQRGWIREADVTLSSTTRHVHIYLDEQELELVDGDEVLLSHRVVIGDPDTPTPPGTYYVTDPQEYPNPAGVYGAFALGLSGYSEVLETFNGGPPQLAVHGTNQPDQVGEAISNGCIRLPNEVVLELADMVDLGTPVTVHDSREDAATAA